MRPLLIVLVIYFLPTLIAILRRLPKSQLDEVIIGNIVLGWSVVFWFLALANALGRKQKKLD